MHFKPLIITMDAYKSAAICEEDLWKKWVFVRKFLVYRGKIKDSETLMLILTEKKLSISDKKVFSATHWENRES